MTSMLLSKHWICSPAHNWCVFSIPFFASFWLESSGIYWVWVIFVLTDRKIRLHITKIWQSARFIFAPVRQLKALIVLKGTNDPSQKLQPKPKPKQWNFCQREIIQLSFYNATSYNGIFCVINFVRCTRYLLMHST